MLLEKGSRKESKMVICHAMVYVVQPQCSGGKWGVIERHTTRLSEVGIKVLIKERSSLDCMRYTVRGKRWKTGCSSEGEDGGLGTGMME